MKQRMAIWASLGFLTATGWVLYTFLTRPESQLAAFQEPAVQALLALSCPIGAIAAHHFPLHFWWVPPINAATYTLIGVLVEGFRRKLRPSHAP